MRKQSIPGRFLSSFAAWEQGYVTPDSSILIRSSKHVSISVVRVLQNYIALYINSEAKEVLINFVFKPESPANYQQEFDLGF